MENSNHFNKIFWLLSAALGLAFLYIYLITFVSIPKENIRFADTAQGFMLGTVVAGVIAYFAGGSPPQKKTEGQPGTTEIELKATQTTPEPSKTDEIVSN